MIANETIDAVHAVITRSVSAEVALAIMDDLREVPGDQSFRDTVEALHERARLRHGEIRRI
jgi:hypothetical protein